MDEMLVFGGSGSAQRVLAWLPLRGKKGDTLC